MIPELSGADHNTPTGLTLTSYNAKTITGTAKGTVLKAKIDLPACLVSVLYRYSSAFLVYLLNC